MKVVPQLLVKLLSSAVGRAGCTCLPHPLQRVSTDQGVPVWVPLQKRLESPWRQQPAQLLANVRTPWVPQGAITLDAAQHFMDFLVI